MELYFLGGLITSDKTREKYVVRTTTLPPSDQWMFANFFHHQGLILVLNLRYFKSKEQS